MDSPESPATSTERGRRFARRLRRALAAVRDVVVDYRPGTVAKLLVAAGSTAPLWYPLRPRSAEGWLLVFVVSLLGLPVALHAATRDPDGSANETARAPDRMSDVGGTTPERDGSDAGSVDADDLDPEAERLLAHLAEFAESGIRPPTRSRMARFGDYHPEAYVDRFGSWETALDAAGVDVGDSDEDATDDTDEADEDATDDTDEEATDDADEEATDDADEEATDDADEEATHDLDPEAERLLAHLREFAESSIRPPTRSRMARFGDHPPSAYVKRFGSWEAALAAAGLGDEESDTDDLDPEVERLHTNLDEFAESGIRVAVDDETPDGDALYLEAERLLAHLREFAESSIRPPTRSRMARFGDHHPEAYVERFGSWEAALDAAGVAGGGDADDGSNAD